MKKGGNTFKIDTSAIARIGTKLGQKTAQYDKTMEQRVRRATDMVWRIAHQKRPMITKAQMKAEGRTYRVSDPSAKAGVPVKTGALQASVLQRTTRTKMMSFRGEVWTKGIKYAPFIEFGTSKMRARPFIRPAVALTKDAIKRVFGLRVDTKI